MKTEIIKCMVCSSPVVKIRLCNNSLEFNKDIEIEILDAVCCEECLKNKNATIFANNIWGDENNKL